MLANCSTAVEDGTRFPWSMGVGCQDWVMFVPLKLHIHAVPPCFPRQFQSLQTGLSNTSGRKEVSLSMAKTNKAIIVPRICRPELDVPTHQNIGTLISFSILPIISVY